MVARLRCAHGLLSSCRTAPESISTASPDLPMRPSATPSATKTLLPGSSAAAPAHLDYRCDWDGFAVHLRGRQRYRRRIDHALRNQPFHQGRKWLETVASLTSAANMAFGRARLTGRISSVFRQPMFFLLLVVANGWLIQTLPAEEHFPPFLYAAQGAGKIIR
jgi:hypothetical protein